MGQPAQLNGCAFFLLKMTSSERNRDIRYGYVWRDVFKRDSSRCVICFSQKQLCIDHVIPVSRGGKSVLENMRILCRSCNTKEGHRGRELDPKLKKKRVYMREWTKQHPGYFTFKTKEFRTQNPGYWNGYSKKQDEFYKNSQIYG
jgi:5-methylcytosine-specific restriction endonuclease McrA